MLARWRERMAGQLQWARRPRPIRSHSPHRPVVEQLEDRQLLSFRPTTIYQAGLNPDATAVGDFNNDGYPDIAVTNTSSNSVSVYLGNGDGTFQPARNFSTGTGTGPQGIALGDFNNDGNLDIATSNFGSNTMSLLLGNGDGTFKPATTIAVGPTGATPFRIAAGDFNNDGNLDVALTIYNGGTGTTVAVLLGNGDGTFSPPASVTVGTAPYSLVVADLNNDGNQDLAVVILGNAAGTASRVEILLGNGDGTFAAPTPAGNIGNLYLGIAAGDFNGDGNTDLVVAEANADALRVLIGNGDGTFQSPVSLTTVTNSGPSFPAVGDFNGDGSQDIAVANQLGNNVTVWLGNGDGTFQPREDFFVGPRPFGLAAGDFNLDGFSDLAGAANTGGYEFILISDGIFPAPPAGAGGAKLTLDQPITANPVNAPQAGGAASLASARLIDPWALVASSLSDQGRTPVLASIRHLPIQTPIDWTTDVVIELLS